MLWPIVSALSSAVYTCAFLATLWYVHRQLLEMKKASETDTHMRRLQSIGAILRFIEGRDVSCARWFAYEHHEAIESLLRRDYPNEFARRHALDGLIRAKSKEQLGKELDIQEFTYPIVALNIVGYFIAKGYVENDIVTEMLGSTFVRTWRAYRCYIEYRRTHRVGLQEDGIEDRLPETKYAYYLEKVVQDVDPTVGVSVGGTTGAQ